MASHRLAIHPFANLDAQRKREVSKEKRVTIDEKVGKLSDVGFITETKYPTWLANIVLVRKSNNRWRMCVDFSDMNTVYSKEPYPLPYVDLHINESSGYHILSFMDAYLGHNQIRMDPLCS